MPINLKHIAIHTPNLIRDNSFYLEHFNNQGKEISSLLKALGKNKRYIATKGKETTLSLGVEAAKNSLSQSGYSINDMDLIIFASQCPEYLIPSQALALYGLLGGSNSAQAFDINANCAGMLVAVTTAYNSIRGSKRINRALIVGADCMSYIAEPTDEFNYPSVGDSACAVIIEEGASEGIIDYTYRTNANSWNLVTFPRQGLSQMDIFKDNTLIWKNFDGRFIAQVMLEATEDLLSETNFSIQDIKAHYVSQFALPIPITFKELLGIGAHVPYIGDKYGYTGVTSPFLALYEDLKEGKIQQGDLINMWTVGTNWTTCNILLHI